MNFKQFRDSKGFGDADKLAKLLDISISYIYMMDNGQRTPSLKLIRKMAAVFRSTLDEVSEIFFKNKSHELLQSMSNQTKQAG